MVKSIELTRGAEDKLMVPLKLFDLDCQRRALAENLSEIQILSVDCQGISDWDTH